jgi:hypothetical protein
VSPGLRATRQAWHTIAEHVLAPALHAATGRIGLRPAPGGVRTPPFGPHSTVVEIDGGDLVVTAGGRSRREPMTTLRAAGTFVGIEPKALVQVYPPATSPTLDEALVVDPMAAEQLAAWFGLGDAALAAFASHIAVDAAVDVQLWPEHFDLATSVADVGYGVSPGDDDIDEPYLYVGPHAGPPPGACAFWNAPFGAARRWTAVRSVDDAVEFFLAGRARLRHRR